MAGSSRSEHSRAERAYKVQQGKAGRISGQNRAVQGGGGHISTRALRADTANVVSKLALDNLHVSVASVSASVAWLLRCGLRCDRMIVLILSLNTVQHL